MVKPDRKEFGNRAVPTLIRAIFGRLGLTRAARGRFALFAALILPLFVYLFLYCIGRSTIHQEPLELDVQIRKNGADTSSYDIDLTFIGLHGVVLGAADQRVLNQEIDTLRDELRWALTGS